MQPPPQALPSGVVGPPPAGSPQSSLWSSSPYRRQAGSNAPVAPIPRPPQPVTDPFAFSRQALQSPSLGSSSKSSLPALQGPAQPAFLQRTGLPVPPTNVGGSSQGPCEPLPGPLSQPRADAGPFAGVSTPSAPPGPERNRSADAAPGLDPEVQALPYLPQYIPGAAPSSPPGGRPQGSQPRPDAPLSRPGLHDGARALAASPLFPQPCQQMPGQWGPGQQGPGQWGPGQGGPLPAGQHYRPCPEGPVQNAVPHTSSVAPFPGPPSLGQGPGHGQPSPLASLPGPSPGDGRNDATSLHGGRRTANSFDPEDAFGQTPGAGNAWASQAFWSSPGRRKEEQLPDLALVNPLAQGSSPESRLHSPLGAGRGWALPEAGSGAPPRFLRGRETENEENLSSAPAGSAGQSDVDGVSPGPGHMAAGGGYQAFRGGAHSEPAPQGGDAKPYFAQSTSIRHDDPAPKGAAATELWGDTACAGTQSAGSSQYENVENLEFVQNQEVPPSEPPSLDPSSLSDQLRYGPPPGPAVPRFSAGGHAGGGGPNLEALDAVARPVRSDSVSSSYSSKSHRGPPGVARPLDAGGTFIQQEVGKPEDEAPGRFFKQIDSSPVGGETDGTTVSQSYRSSLPQPSTPSPPKPTGTFQTSANSSFEPVKSHLVGVKPVEADRANVVGEVRGPRAHPKQHRLATAAPAASPGNLEQPPDNLETLFLQPPGHAPPLPAPAEAGPGPLRAGGLPPEPALPTPEKRPSTRAQGAVKCESPATTLWAQNELPDFGGNVLLAPAAPALQVPAKPQPSEVIQPPDEGASGPQSRQPGPGPGVQSGAGIGASENLENPPQLGADEALPAQAGPAYASLLSAPPAEALQHQPVLIAQPDRSYSLAQPINFSVSLSGPPERPQPWRDPVAGDKPTAGSRALGGDPGERAPPSGAPAGTLVCSPLPNQLAQSHFPQGPGASEAASHQPAHLLVQPLSHPFPKNTLPESPKVPPAETLLPEAADGPAGSTGVMLVPPADSASVSESHKAGPAGGRGGAPGALDSPLSRPLDAPLGAYSPAQPDGPASCQQSGAGHPRPPGPGPRSPDHFYQQVTSDAPSQPPNPGSPPALGQPPNPARPPASPAPADVGPQPPPPRPPRSSSASVVSSSSSQAAARSDPQWLPPPPPDLTSHYYFRSLYEGFPPPYACPYPLDPGAAPHYQDLYSLYDPRYRAYDSAAYAESYRYPEPERPSSRASHCSDRPAARQGYPEGYYHSRGGWSSQSDYYANYYSSQYDYGDPGRWDRYHYGPRVRDPRTYDRRYWYEAEYEAYRRENHAYGDRPEKYDDHWRYDPRFAGSFDDEPEPPRDPYGEEADRRSAHSEPSAPSLRSRRSSFSSHSHQSQVYRAHDAATGPYEAPPPPGSFHGDYAYGTYGGPGFPEFGYAADATWPSVEAAPSRPTSPEKFSVPHVCARFGPGGQLLKVIPNLPSEGQPALVEVHSMEILLQHTPEQEEMRAFPGPLGKDDTHKVDVINFAQNKATKCLQNEHLIDKESASLLWSFIVLLCRQNGTVVGTDVAELLLRDHRTVWLPGKSPDEANLIDFTNEAVEQVEEEESGEAQLSFLTDSQAASSLEKETERFRELLLYGRKKDALESAMKSGLWGHALLLASKMDSRTHARVMTRFANSLPINDPLQTVYQLMSGRMPAASTCCGDEKWGDWRPHLAMVLSNLNNNVDVESRTMATMGDTLASKGLLDAAHFCYLMAQVGFGVYTKKTTKLVLIGSNHSLPFFKFATNEAIQRTEAYEYAQSLGTQACSLPSFQVFKFIYSCRLAEMGLATQAFHYCELIAKSILAQPHGHSPVLVSQLVQVASQLRLFDPQLKEKPEEEALAEPAWLVRLQRLEKQAKEGTVAWSQDGAFPQCGPSSPSSEAGPCDGPAVAQPADLGTANPLLAPPVPGAEHLSQDVRLMPSAPLLLPEGPLAVPAKGPVFPVPPALGPAELGPGCGPSGCALGFPEPPGPDPAALYPGPGQPPAAPSLQEARSQDPGGTPQGAPGRSAFPELEEDSGGTFAAVGSPRMSRDSGVSPGWGSASAGALQPPPPVTSTPEVKRAGPAAKEPREPKKSGESWFSRWLPVKKRTEAYLPDDKNKSIVWDEKRNRWVDVNEPEEEKKPPPPPPTALPKAAQAAHTAPGGPPRASVNVFSRKAAGTRARYVDVLNPGGPQRSEPALAPAELFAPLAPLPMPAHLLGPNPDTEEAPPAEGTSREGPLPAGAPATPEPASEPKAPGDLAPAGGPPGAAVPPKAPSAKSASKSDGEMVLPGFSDADSFVKFALGSVVAVTKASGGLPQFGDEYDFYRSFPGFQAFCETQGDRLLQCMSRVMQYHGCRSNIKDRSKVTELEDKFDLLVDTNDVILERVGILLDEASGVNKNQQPVLPAGLQVPKTIVSSWNRKAGEYSKKTKSETFRLLHAKNIIRPQLKFREKIDNSNTPFLPKIFIKPNAQKPLPQALSKDRRERPQDRPEDLDVPPALADFIHQQRTRQVEQDMFAHPYQYELDHFTPPESVLQKPEPQLYRPVEETPCHFVSSLDELVELNEKLLKCQEFAVDLEHHSYRSFLGLTCLMQISTRTEDFIIDTLELRSDMYILNESLTDPAIVKVFHGADSDIEWLQKDFGLYVVNMFDTHQAARLLNLGRHSLDHLLKLYCSVESNKQYQLADWRIRPLPEEMLSYARDDTHYLLYIYDKMRLALWERGNEQPAQLQVVWQRSRDICLKKFIKPIFTDESYLDLYRKQKKHLNTQQLTAFQLLFAWRDKTARREDESYGYVLPNHMMLKIAEELPKEPQGIIACCNPVPPLVRQQINEMHLLIQQAREMPLLKSEVAAGVRKSGPLPNPERLENVLFGPHDCSHTPSDGYPLTPTSGPVAVQARGLLPAGEEEEALLDTRCLIATAVITLFNEPSAEENGKRPLTVAQKKAQNIMESFENPFRMFLPSLEHRAHISQAAKSDPSSKIFEISNRWKLASQVQVQKESKEIAKKKAAEQTAARDQAREEFGAAAAQAVSVRQQAALETAARKRERVTSDPRTTEQKQEKKRLKISKKPKDPDPSEKEFTPYDYSKSDFKAFAGNSKSKPSFQFDPNKQPQSGKKCIAAKKIKQSLGNKSMSFPTGKSDRGFRHNWPKR